MSGRNDVDAHAPDSGAVLLAVDLDTPTTDNLKPWAFDDPTYGRVSGRGDFHPGRTLIVRFEGEDLRLDTDGGPPQGMILYGDTSPAPFLVFDVPTIKSDPAAPSSGPFTDALFAVVTQAVRLVGAENVFFLGIGRGDYLAQQLGRRFRDSMVLFLKPTAAVFSPPAGGAGGGQPRPPLNFEFYVQEWSDKHGVSRNYFDFKRSVGVCGATGVSNDGRVRFEISEPGIWEKTAIPDHELQYWTQSASRHWRERVGDASDAVSRQADNATGQGSTDVTALGIQVATVQKQLETILAEHRNTARDIRILTKEFRAEARVAHLSSARGVTETVSLVRLASLLFPPDAELPPTGSFAVRPGTLAALVTTIIRATPRVIVECGSGSSSVWLAAALRYLGEGHLYALEHEAKYGAQTQYYLDENGVSSFATIVPAPLEEIEDSGQIWYARSAVNGLPEKIDVLFVDGPPKAVGEHARAPALAELASRLVPGSLVLLDDMQRLDEQEIVSRWLADPSLPELEFVIGLTELHVYRVVPARRGDTSASEPGSA